MDGIELRKPMSAKELFFKEQRAQGSRDFNLIFISLCPAFLAEKLTVDSTLSCMFSNDSACWRNNDNK